MVRDLGQVSEPEHAGDRPVLEMSAAFSTLFYHSKIQYNHSKH